MTRQARTSPGAAYDLECHVVWCPKDRRSVLGGQVKAHPEELIRAEASEHGRPIATPAETAQRYIAQDERVPQCGGRA
ncbi:transposase [Planomonospora parontospora]|uniref:transposase n=1 Tax=Planomonospora parontospora TaxID=58119 RepID=UPI0019C67CAD|nr:transposase [Planomonospora parontospora]GGL35827.1 hypothetical protein GCM10014719_41300 [Planomonospora parontospora subsp. antibiotica]GII17431.1 hypothetical protein Ppa05_41570 [Planomonospora parontospora subsp. antibiotica]